MNPPFLPFMGDEQDVLVSSAGKTPEMHSTKGAQRADRGGEKIEIEEVLNHPFLPFMGDEQDVLVSSAGRTPEMHSTKGAQRADRGGSKWR